MITEPASGNAMMEQGNSCKETIDSIFSRLTLDTDCLLDKLLAGHEQIKLISSGQEKKLRPSYNNIRIPLGENQPKDGPEIVYECRVKGQTSCEVDHLSRSEAGKCQAAYTMKVAANKKKNKSAATCASNSKQQQRTEQASLVNPVKHQPDQSKPTNNVPLTMESSGTKASKRANKKRRKRDRERKLAIAAESGSKQPEEMKKEQQRLKVTQSQPKPESGVVPKPEKVIPPQSKSSSAKTQRPANSTKAAAARCPCGRYFEAPEIYNKL